MSKVSVIVPYLKGPSYLEECIQSIKDQNLSDFEILLVDDRYGDDVPESVLAMKGVRHIVLEQEHMTRALGVAAARNAGICHATGEYLYFLDADDYLWEDALSKLVKLADEKKADVVTGNRYSSWFRPISFTFEKAKPDSEVEGIVPLSGAVLEEVCKLRFTMQHLLIRKSYYESLGITFHEHNTFYSDVPAAVRIFAGAEGRMWIDGSSSYVWRRRNDPVHLPALIQKKRKRRSREFIESYEESHELLEKHAASEKAPLMRALNWQLCKFTYAKFPKWIKGKRMVRYTENLQRIPRKERKKIEKDFPFSRRIELELIRKGKYRFAKRADRLAHTLKKKRGLFGKPIQYWCFLDKYVFQKLPIRDDWVFVESFFGKSYSDNPKYLYEYLYDHYGSKYRYIWCLDKRAKEMKGHPAICRRHSLRYVYYTSRARYIISNVRQPAWFKKRDGVVFLETWHGTPLKRLAFDLDDIHAANQKHKKLFYRHSKVWNYLVSANRFSTDVFERAFCYPRERIIESGYPRNDILYSERAKEITEEVKAELGIPKDKRVILYAPTWRDDEFYEKAKYKFNLALDLQQMRNALGEDSVLLLRTHYYIADSIDLTGVEDFVYNGSKYNDVSRLYLASDICITDYSSVFFDYANLKRPMLFFTYDLEKYRGVLRGFYMDMEEEVPGPMLFNTEEIIHAIQHIDDVREEYAEKYDRFYEKYCAWEDGHAAEKVVNTVFNGK